MSKAIVLLLLAVGSATDWRAATAQVPAPADDAPEETFRLWQQRSADPGKQMMGYVIQTSRNGRLIVIDGGLPGDRTNLRNFLRRLRDDETVSAWFVSHPHRDHVGALAEMLSGPESERPPIEALYASLLTNAELAKGCDDAAEAGFARDFNAVISATTVRHVDLELGAVLNIDGVKIEVLGVKNPELNSCSEGNLVNDSSVVLRVSDGARSVLFTGDLGRLGGCKVLEGNFRARLRAGYVQMSHHGSYGVDESFYQSVGARFCLWPTARVIFENVPSCPVPPADHTCGAPPPDDSCAPDPNKPDQRIVPPVTAYRSRVWVQPAAMCGPADSHRHFLSFEGNPAPGPPFFQLIP